MPGTRGGPAGGPKNGVFHGGGSAAAPHTAPTVGEVVERVVGRFDGDGDDVITLAEVLAVLDPDGTRTTLAEKAAAAVAEADTDGNHALSSAELTAAVAALDTDADGTLDRDDRGSTATDAPAIGVLLHAHGPRDGEGHGLPQTVATIVERVFVRIDGDDNGTISLAELVQHLGRRGDADADARAAELLLALDSNQDQAIGSDELGTAVAALDTDGSGSLSAAEHQAAVDADVALVGVLHGC